MDQKDLWQAVLGELEINLSKASFTTWFKDTFISSFENGVAVIGVPNLFHKEWLENKYKDEIFKTLSKLSSDKISEVKYKVITKKEIALPKTTPFIAKKEKEAKEVTLNPLYTFNNFVIGSSNRLAHAAAKAVAKSPGKTYNPLFIYGGVGLGKTHLMQAIGNELLGKGGVEVLYATCEKFTNEFIQSVQSGRASHFKNKYRNIDILLIDDIQFLANKESTQEEFFHTFNTLYQNNKQVVISSDRPPKALSSLEDRLVSRFEGGMVADISLPDLETRVAILKRKQQEKNYSISDEILELIAGNIEQNIRELEGVLTRLIATCQLSGEEPTMERANQILGSYSSQSKNSLNSEKVLNEVADFYGLKKEDILNRKRDRDLVHPRQIAMYLLRRELNYSYPKIGKELKRDHTTIIHGCGKIEKAITQDNGLKQEITLIKTRIYGD
ncbi:MAG: chromosomal replication initiator protein DnaA [Candidatus Berkelbacteria bacterium]|nr:chromosomal replication initiator protein DnaA [Candidatus Berkelbacteria bacterium]